MATVDAYLRLAAAQIGVEESPPESNRVKYSTWYGVAAPWCQMLQNWLHVSLGMEPPGFVAGTVPKGSAYTPTCADWFRRKGRWSTRPERGALVYYDFPGDGVDRISHVGVVERINANGSIVAIEGNTDERGGRTGGKVMRKVRTTGIVGYGMPLYGVEDDMYDDEAEKRLFARIEAGERRTARYVDHGDVEVAGSADHHKQIREDIRALATTQAAILEALGKIAPGAVAGDVTVTGTLHLEA
jgi:surface antigen